MTTPVDTHSSMPPLVQIQPEFTLPPGRDSARAEEMFRNAEVVYGQTPPVGQPQVVSNPTSAQKAMLCCWAILVCPIVACFGEACAMSCCDCVSQPVSRNQIPPHPGDMERDFGLRPREIVVEVIREQEAQGEAKEESV